MQQKKQTINSSTKQCINVIQNKALRGTGIKQGKHLADSGSLLLNSKNRNIIFQFFGSNFRATVAKIFSKRKEISF